MNTSWRVKDYCPTARSARSLAGNFITPYGFNWVIGALVLHEGKFNDSRLVRPTGIEPVLRVPETLVISFSLRARQENF
jgi:hypothetical protein